jgi:uncharacterized protein (TIGR03437 family)
MRNHLRLLPAVLAALMGGLVPGAAQAQGTITTIAGNGVAGFAGDGGPALNASFNTPAALAIGPDGSLYIADITNHRIRRIAPNGTVSTVAGNGVATFGGDGGPGTAASLREPTGVVVDRQGNVFIADAANSRIRKVDTNGVITTIAGTGVGSFSGDGGPATAATLQCPTRVALDGFENLYIADQCNHRIRKIDRNGIITTVAGSGTPGAQFGGFSGDGGAATGAQFKHPTSVTIDRGGNIYVTDQQNHRIRRVAANGTVTTIAGSGVQGFSGDGGQATAAATNQPGTVAVDSTGNVYFADNLAHRIRKVDRNGIITTVVGNGVASSTGDGGPPSAATVNNPFGITLDDQGNLYVVESSGNRIRKVTGFAPVAPTFSSAGITNGASFQANGTPGGAIATIFGINLSSVNGIVQATSVPLPTQLGGTSVRISGVLAPLFAVVRLDNGQEQINLQIPFELIAAAQGPAQAQQFVEVVVTSNGVSNAPVLMQLAPAQPGIFLVDGVNGAILHGATNTLISAQSPATRGEAIVIFATGLGRVENPPATGNAASLTTLSPTIADPSVTVGGRQAEVIFSGLAPGFVGLYQINIYVPQSAPSGSADVVVTMNGVTSNTAKMAVQ